MLFVREGALLRGRDGSAHIVPGRHTWLRERCDGWLMCVLGGAARVRRDLGCALTPRAWVTRLLPMTTAAGARVRLCLWW